jgi:hypothetical protein
VKEKALMHNPVTATHDPVERGVTAPPAIRARNSGLPRPARFVPLFTRAVRLAITTVTDELGRPLLGVLVPDGELL